MNFDLQFSTVEEGLFNTVVMLFIMMLWSSVTIALGLTIYGIVRDVWRGKKKEEESDKII
ncbi:MAG: hypothetical protein JW759_00990 [Candidatus Coatesbacteria bacterium]|nr:hypothetical protein [Candidatus Coatesbacteria bacterium]